MKVKTVNNNKKVIIKLNWFQKHKNLFFLFYLFIIPLIYPYKIYWNESITSSYIIMVCVLYITLFPLIYFFTFRSFLEINFKAKKFIIYKKLFGKLIKLKFISFFNISSIKNLYSKNQNGQFYDIVAILKNRHYTIYLMEIQTFIISQRKVEFFKYYFDLLNIYIVKLLKEKGFQIKSELLTGVKEHISSDLNFNNLKRLAKEYLN